jgi:hypothetical protein
VQIAADVLPEIRQLQRGAGVVGEALALLVAIPADIEDETPDGIGAAAAIIGELLERIVARDALVLLEGVDQIEERLDGDVMAVDGLVEREVDGAGRIAGVTVMQLASEAVEKLERLLDVVNFIAQIVRDSAEGVDVAEILSQALRQEQGDDGEILVMRRGQIASEGLSVGGSGGASEGGGCGGRVRLTWRG